MRRSKPALTCPIGHGRSGALEILRNIVKCMWRQWFGRLSDQSDVGMDLLLFGQPFLQIGGRLGCRKPIEGKAAVAFQPPVYPLKLMGQLFSRCGRKENGWRPFGRSLVTRFDRKGEQSRQTETRTRCVNDEHGQSSSTYAQPLVVLLKASFGRKALKGGHARVRRPYLSAL